MIHKSLKHPKYVGFMLLMAIVLCLFAIMGFSKFSNSALAQRNLLDNSEKGLNYKQLRKTNQDNRCKSKFEIIDRAGNARGCTHGPDPTPDDRTVAYEPAPKAKALPQQGNIVQAPGDVLCAGDGISGRRFEVIYARASDQPDRYAEYVASFRQYMGTANEIAKQSGLQTGEARQFRFVTEPAGAGCQVAVRNVVLPVTGDDDIYETISELQNLGYTNPDYKYVTLMDANVYCGIAEMWWDDRAGPDNYNNRNFGGSMYSRIDTACWDSTITIAHEMVHSIGGVQDTAPNATDYGHCVDEYDALCYQDAPEVVLQYICPLSEQQRFDCNKNDYFNTNPVAGSYLANFWNTARNSYLIKGDVPDNTAPTVTFDSLSNGSHVRGTINPAINITDSEETIRIRLYVDGILVKTDLIYPYTDLSWITTNYSSGQHTLRAEVTDASGNIGTTAEINVTVDNIAPSAPTNLNTTMVLSNRVDLAWNNSTDNIGVTNYTVKRNGLTIGSSSTNSYSDTTVVASSGYSYQVQATDQAGNTADSASLYVSVPSPDDLEAPTGAITSPPNGSLIWADKVTGNINIQATASDNQTVASVQLFVNGTLYGNLASGSPGQYSTEWFSIYLNPGVYDLTVRVTDLNGNSQLSAPVSLTLATPVHRLYRTENNKHFYTGSSLERDVTAQGSYRYEDISFYASPAAIGDTNVPVYRLYNAATETHFYTASSSERDYAVTLGYNIERIEFYAATDTANGEFVPVYRLYNAASRNYLFTPSIQERDNAINLGLSYEGVGFYAKEASASNINPIYRLNNTRNYDHLFTASPLERSNALQSGYVDEGIGFYARSSANYGYAPVFRMYKVTTGDHFYTASSTERDSAIGLGYSYEGIALYSQASGGDGQTSIYRLYNSSTGKHLYTSSYNEVIFATGQGYSYEGVGFFAID